MSKPKTPSKPADPRAEWRVPAAALAKNEREDSDISKLEQRLAVAHKARRGRLINEFGWAWCSGCGAQRVKVNLDSPDEALLVEGRTTAVCGVCHPDRHSIFALARFIEPDPELGLTDSSLEDWIRNWTGRPTPERSIRAFAARLLPDAIRRLREEVDRVHRDARAEAEAETEAQAEEIRAWRSQIRIDALDLAIFVVAGNDEIRALVAEARAMQKGAAAA